MAFGTVKLDSITTSTQTLTADNLLESADIGVSVQAYDANLPAGNVIVVDSDIGSTVQAYNAKLAAVAGLAVTDGNIIVGNGSTFVAENGATARTSLGVAIGSDVQAYDANNAVTDASQTFTAGQRGEITTLTSGSTVTPNFNDSNNFTLTLGTNVTLANPTNLTAGQSGSIFLVQDGTGSRTLSFGSYWDFAGGTAPTITTTANAVDRLDYIVRSSTSIHAVVTLAYS